MSRYPFALRALLNGLWSAGANAEAAGVEEAAQVKHQLIKVGLIEEIEAKVALDKLLQQLEFEERDRETREATAALLQKMDAQSLRASRPAAPLREAAERLLAKVPVLTENCIASSDVALLHDELLALRAALAAPAPGREELERKLRELWQRAVNEGEERYRTRVAADEGDEAIADLLALWEARHG